MFNGFIITAVDEFYPLSLHGFEQFKECIFRFFITVVPAFGFQHYQTPRFLRVTDFFRAIQTRITRVRPGTIRDLVGNRPHVWKGRGMDPEVKLAQAQSFTVVQGTDGRFNGKVSAVGGGPDDRTHHLVAQSCRDHPRSHRRGSPAGRSSGSRLRIERVGGRSGFDESKFRRHCFTQDYPSGKPQSIHRSRIQVRFTSSENRTSQFSRHVPGLEYILDPQGHSINHRKGHALTVTFPRFICRLSCVFLV